jgi:hypothetical protein
MEQQIADGETLSFLEHTTAVKFCRGCYSCKGVEGSYSTLENLKEAWIDKLREDKRRELNRIARELRHTKVRNLNGVGYGHKLKYLRSEKERWQITKLGK